MAESTRLERYDGQSRDQSTRLFWEHRPAMEAAGWEADLQRWEGDSLVVLYRTDDLGSTFVPSVMDTGPAAGSRPPTLIRTYRGGQQADAVRIFQRDAQQLSRIGYVPVSQSWAQGQWGCGAFLVALLLAVFLIGILIFIYLLIVKPEGTLTVTYQLQTQPSPRQQTPATGSLASRLAQLDEARRNGYISEDEYAQKRGELLAGF